MTIAVSAQSQTLGDYFKVIQRQVGNQATEALLKKSDEVIGNILSGKKKKQREAATTTAPQSGSIPTIRDVSVLSPSSDRAGDASAAAEWQRKAEEENDAYKKIEYCNQALKADPSAIDTYYLRAIYLVDVGNYEKAAADLDKFLDYRPNHSEALNGRGYCYQQLDRHTDAIRDFGQSIANNNENLDFVFNNRGWSYALLKDYDHAIKDFDQAVKLNPNLVEALLRKGWCLQQVDLHAEAVKAFDLAINQQTNYTQAWYLRGVSKAALNYHREAILDYNKVLSQSPTDQEALLARALSRIALEKFPEAIDDCATLIRANPDHTDAYNTRGYCLLQQNKNSEALTDFNKCLTLKPQGVHLVYTNRGQAYVKLQMYREALADYQQALLLLPNHPEAVAGRQQAERLLNPGGVVGTSVTRQSNLLNRYALVIGNSGYLYTKTLSDNPLNDAKDMGKRLQELGFTVTQVSNATRRQMQDALQAFSNSARHADVITIFYAGHGIENGGVNYLIPTDARIDSLKNVKNEAVALDDVFSHLRRCEAKVTLVFLDACRNNPFRSWSVNRATDPLEEAKRGAFTNPPPLSVDEVVFYATQPKEVAGNGSSRNGDLTRGLLDNLRRGTELTEMWRGVTNTVMHNTNRVQKPYFSGSLGSEFVF